MPVGGHLATAGDGRADPAHRRHRGDASGDVGDRGSEASIVDAFTGALDEDVLAVGGQLRLFERDLGPTGLARQGFGVGQLTLADLGAADRERDDDKGEPPEYGRLAMSRAPFGGAGCDVHPGFHWVPFGEVDLTQPGSQRQGPAPMRLPGVSAYGRPTPMVWLPVPLKARGCRTIGRCPPPS